MDQSTNIGEEKSPDRPGKKETHISPQIIAIAGIGLVVVLALVFMNPWGGGGERDANNNQNTENQNAKNEDPPTKGKTAEGLKARTQIFAIRLSSDQKYIDTINNNTPEGQVVYEGERSRLEVLLPERSYLMVLGITPGAGEDKVHCLWPKDSSTLPFYCDGLIYGKRPAEQLKITFSVNHYLAVRDETWHYTDGAGLHAFVAISSQTLLPSFGEVKEELLEIDWPTDEVDPKHWTIQAGEAFVNESKQFRARRTDDTDAFTVQPVVDHIKSLFVDARVDGIVFNVEKSSTGTKSASTR